MENDRRTWSVVRYEIHDGVIRSDARMTYTAVNAILTDRDPDVIATYRELVPMFELMKELFEILNARRTRRGSVDFDLPEAQVVLNEEGFIEDIVASERPARDAPSSSSGRTSETCSGEKNTGIQPSAISPASVVFFGPIAAR